MLLVTLAFLPTHTEHCIWIAWWEGWGGGYWAKDMEKFTNWVKQQEEQMVQVGQHLEEMKNILFAMHGEKHYVVCLLISQIWYSSSTLLLCSSKHFRFNQSEAPLLSPSRPITDWDLSATPAGQNWPLCKQPSKSQHPTPCMQPTIPTPHTSLF